MRRGRIEKADSVTKRIGQSIVDHAKVTFSSSIKGSKELWEKVRLITGKNNSDQCLDHVAVEELNQHFASVSTDQYYTSLLAKATVPAAGLSSSFSEYQVFQCLDHLKHTSAGLDSLPHWFLQMGAPSFCLPLCHLPD